MAQRVQRERVAVEEMKGRAGWGPVPFPSEQGSPSVLSPFSSHKAPGGWGSMSPYKELGPRPAGPCKSWPLPTKNEGSTQLTGVCRLLEWWAT